MSDEKLTETSTKLEDFDHATADDSDNYYTISLYQHSDNRHFRWIDASGMNSRFNGSLGFDRWLSENEVSNWKDV